MSILFFLNFVISYKIGHNQNQAGNNYDTTPVNYFI